MHAMTKTSNNRHPPFVRRTSMLPIDSDGYKDLLLEVDETHHQDSGQNKSNQFVSRSTSNRNTKSRTSETTIC